MPGSLQTPFQRADLGFFAKLGLHLRQETKEAWPPTVQGQGAPTAPAGAGVAHDGREAGQRHLGFSLDAEPFSWGMAGRFRSKGGNSAKPGSNSLNPGNTGSRDGATFQCGPMIELEGNGSTLI